MDVRINDSQSSSGSQQRRHVPGKPAVPLSTYKRAMTYLVPLYALFLLVLLCVGIEFLVEERDPAAGSCKSADEVVRDSVSTVLWCAFVQALFILFTAIYRLVYQRLGLTEEPELFYRIVTFTGWFFYFFNLGRTGMAVYPASYEQAVCSELRETRLYAWTMIYFWQSVCLIPFYLKYFKDCTVDR